MEKKPINQLDSITRRNFLGNSAAFLAGLAATRILAPKEVQAKTESKYSNESELKAYYDFAETNKNKNEVKNNITIRINIEDQTLTVLNDESSICVLPIGVARRKNENEGYHTPTPAEENYPNFIINYMFTKPILDLVFYIKGDNAYSIHETPDESTIPGKVSQGCIRLKKKALKSLFKIVKVGTKVFID